MRLICEKSVKQKVDELIDEADAKGLTPVRLEMNPQDFRQFCNEIDKGYINDGQVSLFCEAIGQISRCTDGSYVVYKGVCVQCHSNYPRVKPEIAFV